LAYPVGVVKDGSRDIWTPLEWKLCGSLDGVLKQLVYERLVGLALPRGQLA
jgi:hypothetical protein